jgi:quercetin dioxygenase-like cupin family protein
MSLTLTAPNGAPTRIKAKRASRAGAPKGFVVSHAKGAKFHTGLRAYMAYRDLGIAKATEGRIVAHVIKAATPLKESVPHYHATEFQLVYVLKGWIEFDYEGTGRVRLEAGSCVHQPPGIRHAELGHSDDLELLEVVMPATFDTVEVETVERNRPKARAKAQRPAARARAVRG